MCHITKESKLIMLVCFALWSFLGCESPQPVSLPQPTIPTYPTPTATRIRMIRKVADIGFHIENITTNIIDSQTLSVRGQIVRPFVTITCQKIHEQLIQYGEPGSTNWQAIKEDFPTSEVKPWNLSEINATGQWLSSEPDCKLNPDGAFTILIKAQADYYFLKPESKAGFKSIEHNGMLSLTATHLEEKCTTSYDNYFTDSKSFTIHKAIPYTLYSTTYDADKTRQISRELLESLIRPCRISLEFKEQLTRREVSPDIKITPTSAKTRQDYADLLRTKLVQKFDNNSTLVSIGIEVFDSYFNTNKGKIIWTDIITDRAQIISFIGLVGCQYKIEATHGEYIYFRGFITPSSTEPVNKTVLLVEKGEKVRVQEVKDGEGGAMVDN